MAKISSQNHCGALGKLVECMLDLSSLQRSGEEKEGAPLPYSERTEVIIALSELRQGRKMLTIPLRQITGDAELWYDKNDPSFALVVSYESQWKGGRCRSFCPVSYRVIESEEERLSLLAGSKAIPRQRHLQFERAA